MAQTIRHTDAVMTAISTPIPAQVVGHPYTTGGTPVKSARNFEVPIMWGAEQTEAFRKAMVVAFADKYTYSGDPKALDKLHTLAWKRDMLLTDEEMRAKEEATRECILGQKWWLRAHP